MARKPRADDLAPRKGKNGYDDQVQYWLDEIAACRRREKHFRKDGMRIREIYSGELKESTPMNILFSNTETISPALYSQVPRPVVRRRYKDDDPIGFAAAKAGQRILEFLLDTNIEGYDTVDECLKAVTLDALLPGRGISTLKYDVGIDYVDDGQDEAGKPKQAPIKKPHSELVCPEIRSWDRVYFGFAHKWSKVPWIAYEEHIDRKEATRLFGADIAGKIKYSRGETSENEGEQGVDRSQDERNTGGRKTALIYQIWDKLGGQKIRYVSPNYRDGYLLVAPDELKITGFYNCPRPVKFIDKTDDLTPTSPYCLYEQQAKELNELTVRITNITRAIKARGVYDTELGADLANIMEADDNQLVPADKASSLAAEKGLQNAIWFMPLEVLVATLRELVAAREQCKQVIYEITGISDIIRGASKASETLGAQQIKSQWGTLRIKPKQAEVQRYACDMLRIMLEIAAQKFSEETWAKMTGLPYMTSEQIPQAQQMIQAAGQQAQLMAQKAQQSQALASRAITPEQQQQIANNQQAAVQQAQQAQQQVQQLQQKFQQTPKWPAVLAMLRDDIQRAFKIDIETNSTIEPEAAEDQKNISDLMQALSQFLQSVGPMVAQGIMPFQVAQSMLLSITRRFRFGDEIEEMIQQMQPPPPQDKSAEALKQAQGQLQQLQSQLQQKDAQAQKESLDHAAKQANAKQTIDKMAAESDIKNRETQLALDKKQLDYDRRLFATEQKHASDSVAKSAEIASKKLENQKLSMSDGEKTAKVAHHLATGALTQIDQRVTDSVGAALDIAIAGIKQIEQKVGGTHSALLKRMEQDRQDVEAMIRKVAAPRKKRAVRDQTGRIAAVVDEPVDLNA